MTVSRRAAFAAALLMISVSLAAQGRSGARVARLGVLLFGTLTTDSSLSAFLAGLRELGCVEGQNVALEYRYAEGRPERVRALALQIVSMKPDVVVVLGATWCRS